MAMELSRAMRGEAMAAAQVAAATPADQPKARAAAAEHAGRLVAVFNQAARAVRQTFALEARLERPARQPGVGTGAHDESLASAERARKAWQGAEAEARTMLRRAAVLNTLEPLIRTDPREDERERLMDELYERLDTASTDPDFIHATPDALIRQIHREFGLAPPPGGGPLGPPNGKSWMHRGDYNRRYGDP